METYKEQWLEQKLLETFGDSEEFAVETVWFIYQYCWERIRYTDITENTPDDFKQAVWDKVCYYMRYDFPILRMVGALPNSLMD